MTGSVETELKLRLVNADVWRDLLTWTGWNGIADIQAWRHENLEAQYFDTPEHDLRQARLAYRIRRENGSWIAAVKGGGTSAGGLHRRNEWEVSVEEAVPSVGYFAETPIGEQLAGAVGDKLLEPLFITRFERHTLLVRPDEETLIEVAIDRGAILAGDNQEPIQELELELKSGALSTLLALGAKLAGDYPLIYEEQSKYYRGLLAAGLAEKPSKARRIPIDVSQPAGAGAKELVLRGIYAAMREQVRFLSAPHDPGRLHRFRIRLRMLRAFLSFVRPLTNQDECREFQNLLRERGQMLGPVREMDVLAEGWSGLENSLALSLTGRQWLKEVLAAERGSQLALVWENLIQAQTTPVFLNLWAWLEDQVWEEQSEETFAAFCQYRLKNWYESIVDFGKKPDWRNMDNLHRLRIAGKKLRYVLEELDGAQGFSAEELIPRLKLLQDQLGYLRDAHLTNINLTKLLADKSSRAVHREAGLLIGWHARGAFENQRPAYKAWRRVRRKLLKQIKDMND